METFSSPKKTIEIIQKYNFDFQKKFGQNFLIDSHVLEKIIGVHTGEGGLKHRLPGQRR